MIVTNPCAVPLARYAQIIGYDECAFFGIAYDGQSLKQCGPFWSEWQRQAMARALSQAQQMLEDFIRYPLCPTWIVGELADGVDPRFVDEQPFHGSPALTRWGHVLAGGVRAVTDVALNAAVSYADPDIAVVGPLPYATGLASEIVVSYPDSDRAITPSRVTVDGGEVTIEIPRCRLLKEELLFQTGGDEGWEKDDTTNFVAGVDVRRVYNDPSVNAQMVRAHQCGAACANGCTESTDSACMVMQDGVIGRAALRMATYSDGQWRVGQTCRGYAGVRLNYLAGQRRLPPNTEDVIVRLAHSLMPDEPCGCERTQILWQRDRHTPEILTRERLNCPFGTNDGAWFAYMWARSNALVRGYVF